jgi:hypothetical protein
LSGRNISQKSPPPSIDNRNVWGESLSYYRVVWVLQCLFFAPGSVGRGGELMVRPLKGDGRSVKGVYIYFSHFVSMCGLFDRKYMNIVNLLPSFLLCELHAVSLQKLVSLMWLCCFSFSSFNDPITVNTSNCSDKNKLLRS